MEFFENLVELL
jgi:importin subunit beta-1